MAGDLKLSWDEVVHNRSLENIIMLSKCVPDYSIDKKNKKGKPIPESGESGNIGSIKGLFSALGKPQDNQIQQPANNSIRWVDWRK